MTDNEKNAVFRVLDANLNRLREALRVIEEYFRFILSEPNAAIQLKLLRHSLKDIEGGFKASDLLNARDTTTDPFAHKNRQEELDRADIMSVLKANFKRSQEASRVIEEYSKVLKEHSLSEKMKSIRFTLYALEKGLNDA